MVTIKNIARTAGVSDATVSMVLAGDPRISQATQKKVLAISRRMKYFPNLAARSLRQGGTKSIGFLVNDITNSFYALMIQSAEAAAAERGFQLLIGDSQWNPDREARAIENMILSRVKGMLVCLSEQNPQSLKLLRQAAVPVVLVDTHPASYRGSFVGNDTATLGRLAAQHLANVGCRCPVLMTADVQMQHFSAFNAIQRGFRETLAKSRVTFAAEHVINAGLTIQAGRLAFLRAREGFPKMDGVFCMNDLCALGVMMAVEEAGLRIGRDLAVMGIDDLWVASLPWISLTSLREPHAQVAQTAASVLLNAIEQGKPPSHRQMFTPELVARRSTESHRRRSGSGAPGVKS